MALTPDQTAYAQAELGADVDLADVEARTIRLQGDLSAAVLEVLRTRLAALRNAPAVLTIPGAISVNQAENMRSLEAQVTRLASGAGGGLSRARAHPNRARR